MTRRLQRTRFLGTLAAPLGLLLPTSARAADTYTLRLSVPQPATSVLGLVGIRLAQRVEKRTNGQVKIEVFPNGQLSAQEASVDATIQGVIDFTIQSANFIEALFPRFQVLGMPFLFKTENAGHKVLDGPIGQGLLGELPAKGLIGYGWTGSFRELWCASRTVSTPEEMKGIRARIPGGAVGLAMYQTLGAQAITIDSAEIMTSLSQHVIDGIDTNCDSFTTSKFYIGAKRANMLNHIFSVNMMMGSKRKIEALPAPLQKIIMEEGHAAQPYWRELIVKQTTEDIEILKKSGVSFTSIQFPAFRKAVEPVYTQFRPRLGGDILDRTIAAAG